MSATSSSAASTSSSSCGSRSCLILANGVLMPAIACGLGFGDWFGEIGDFKGMLTERAWFAIDIALKAGFRHFDTARSYSTERHLGDSLGKYFCSGELQRSDIFITSKICHPIPSKNLYISHRRVWNPRDIPPETIRQKILDDFDKSLEDLGVGYLDLLLMHWPGGFDETDENFARQHRLRVWRIFEELYTKKVVRAIGVCNFTIKHLTDLINDGAKIVPMINQIEVHPYCRDRNLIQFCKDKNIIIQAYAPLASGQLGLLKDPLLINIAKQMNKSVAQIILKWHLQHGYCIMPKSSNIERAKDNLALFDFELNAEQMACIDNLHPENQPPKRTRHDPQSVV